MGMAIWREVVDTTTGRIYASYEDVERKTGIPAKLVDACDQTGKTINGHRFKRVVRQAPDGCPSWVHAGEESKEAARKARARSGMRSDGRVSPGTVTTPEDQAHAVEMYKRGALLSDISVAMGREVGTRDITRWNGGTTPPRPDGFWNHGQGRGIIINNNRPSWKNDA